MYLTILARKYLRSHPLLQFHLLHFPPPPPLPLLLPFFPIILLHLQLHPLPALPLPFLPVHQHPSSHPANASALQSMMNHLYLLQHLKLAHVGKAELPLAPLHCKASKARWKPLMRPSVNEDNIVRLQNHSVRAKQWNSFMTLN